MTERASVPATPYGSRLAEDGRNDLWPQCGALNQIALDPEDVGQFLLEPNEPEQAHSLTIEVDEHL